MHSETLPKKPKRCWLLKDWSIDTTQSWQNVHTLTYACTYKLIEQILNKNAKGVEWKNFSTKGAGMITSDTPKTNTNFSSVVLLSATPALGRRWQEDGECRRIECRLAWAIGRMGHRKTDYQCSTLTLTTRERRLGHGTKQKCVGYILVTWGYLGKSSFLLFHFHMSVCESTCVWAHVGECACMWRRKVGVWNHPTYLFHFLH